MKKGAYDDLIFSLMIIRKQNYGVIKRFKQFEMEPLG